MAKILNEQFSDQSEDDPKITLDALSKKGLSTRSIEDYEQTMRKFYRWFLPKRKYNKACLWFRIRNNVERMKKSEEMLNDDEINSIVAGCRNYREKTLFSLAYDSGCRVVELLSLRLRDAELYGIGLTLHVTGKRRVYVVGDPIAYPREWRQVHSHRDEPNSPLFAGMVTEEDMTYDSARVSLHKAATRTGIKNGYTCVFSGILMQPSKVRLCPKTSLRRNWDRQIQVEWQKNMAIFPVSNRKTPSRRPME